MKIPVENTNILGDINKQLLGLTDEHIHYFTADNLSNQSLINDKEQKSAQAQLKSNIGIHHQMVAAFELLRKSAKTAGIELKIASGFRSFDRQLHIWNNKFEGNTPIKKANNDLVDITHLSNWEITQAILLFSALPGASRHHWGCDIDVYAPNLLASGKSLQLEPWEYQPSGPMAKLSTWLTQYAAKFGFYLPYDCYRGGVAAEPWHLSYAPLARQYQSAFTAQALQACLTNTDISGKTAIIDNLPEITEQYIINVNTRM